MIARFRLMRLLCHIHVNEVAEAAALSNQRITQFETRYYGCKPKNPERLIQALEAILAQRKRDIEKVEYICKNQRETIFDYVDGDTKL